MMAARVGALLLIEEIRPDGKRSIGLPLRLTDGGTLLLTVLKYQI
jgi:hypothetical protein